MTLYTACLYNFMNSFCQDALEATYSVDLDKGTTKKRSVQTIYNSRPTFDKMDECKMDDAQKLDMQMQWELDNTRNNDCIGFKQVMGILHAGKVAKMRFMKDAKGAKGANDLLYLSLKRNE